MGSNEETNPETILRETLRLALERSSRELVMLANFYHQRGYIKEAQEIFQLIGPGRDRQSQDVGTNTG